VVPPDARADGEVRTADLSVPGEVAAAVAGADLIVNLVKHSGDWRGADRDPQSEQVNVGTMRALIAAVRAGRAAVPPVCVFAGTVSQVGLPPARPMDGSEPDHPLTAYDSQKLAAEVLLKAATADGVLRGISLRLPTIYGQRSATSAPDVGVVVGMARRAFAGEPLTMWDGGSVQRELVHVEDTADAFLAALDRPAPLVGAHWLVGTGEPRSLAALFGRISRSVAACTGRAPVPVVSTPAPAYATATDRASVLVDPAPFRAAAGWTARIPMEEGIDRTVAALAAQRRSRSRTP
jgi:nucleoside-diphosphate-sugar epimerase